MQMFWQESSTDQKSCFNSKLKTGLRTNNRCQTDPRHSTAVGKERLQLQSMQ